MNNTFFIDIGFLTDVRYVEEYSIYRDKTELTEEELTKVLKGQDRVTITGSKEHPEFAKLREYLGDNGFIAIERGWHNGDRALKQFYLNGALFAVGDKFPCSVAMKFCIDWKLKGNSYY